MKHQISSYGCEMTFFSAAGRWLYTAYDCHFAPFYFNSHFNNISFEAWKLWHVSNFSEFGFVSCRVYPPMRHSDCVCMCVCPSAGFLRCAALGGDATRHSAAGHLPPVPLGGGAGRGVEVQLQGTRRLSGPADRPVAAGHCEPALLTGQPPSATVSRPC